MIYFSTITSFADLKKQYRTLAIEHHPDKGGDVKKMQEVNAEFDKLYKIWQHRKDETTSRTGYESDYDGATSKQYSESVYNEYRWQGSRYKGQYAPEIIETVRGWLKDTYPRCKFSATRNNYNSLHVNLITADFEVFNEEHKNLVNCSMNHYNLDSDDRLTERAREVMSNVNGYVMSYNYDNSDPMTDYFCTNFYLTLGIGKSTKPFKVVVPELACPKGKEAPVFKFPEGKAHKAIRQALNGSIFDDQKFRDGKTLNVLGDTHYYSSRASFYPKCYGGRKTAQKRVDKLTAAGIICHISDSYVVFDGYTPETMRALEVEIQAEKDARIAWEEEQQNPTSKDARRVTDTKAKVKTNSEEIASIVADGIEIIGDYSEKAFAIVGETKSIKDTLKGLGGRFNPRLTCGAGWVFPKTKMDIVKQTLSIA